MLHHVDFRVNRASYSHTDCIVSIHDYTRTIIGAPSYRNRASTVTETSLGPDQTPQSTWPCRGSLLPRILEPVTSFLPLTTLCPEQLAARSPSSRGRQSEPCAAQSTGGTDGAQGRHLERNRGACLNYAATARATEMKTPGSNSPAELEGNDSATMIAETAKGNDQHQVHINSWLKTTPIDLFFPVARCKFHRHRA